MVVIHSRPNFLSAMHGFRDNEVFLPTGYDFIVSPPQGSTARTFSSRILKERPWFHDWNPIVPFIWDAWLAQTVCTSENGVLIPFPVVLDRDHHREQTRHSSAVVASECTVEATTNRRHRVVVCGLIRQPLHGQGEWDSCRHSECTSCMQMSNFGPHQTYLL